MYKPLWDYMKLVGCFALVAFVIFLPTPPPKKTGTVQHHQTATAKQGGKTAEQAQTGSRSREGPIEIVPCVVTNEPIPVLAAHYGKVREIRQNSGLFVIALEDDFRLFRTTYSMSHVRVKNGQRVMRGQRIGTLAPGKTLNFGLMRVYSGKQEYVDPRPLMLPMPTDCKQ